MSKWYQNRQRVIGRERMIPRVKAIGLLIVSAILFATSAFSENTTETWRGLWW